MPAFLTVALPLLQSALGVIGAFKGTAQQARATGYVQDAVSLIGALYPLLEQFSKGADVTPEQVKAALAGKDEALKQLDDLIASRTKPS